MKREILDAIPHNWNITGCCPGHDVYPDDTYSSRRSKKARARDKKKEHQHARSIAKREMIKELYKGEQNVNDDCNNL